MDWLQKQAYEKFKACYGMVIPSDMTPLQTAERMFYPYKIQTEILMEYLNMNEIPFCGSWFCAIRFVLCWRRKLTKSDSAGFENYTDDVVSEGFFLCNDYLSCADTGNRKLLSGVSQEATLPTTPL